MDKKEHFRHELKYEINYENYLILRQRLRYVMKPDVHTGSDGCYRIYSIYFDNMNDKALREKINGVLGMSGYIVPKYKMDVEA